MSAHLRVGMGQPYALRVTVPDSSDFDPTTPTGVVFKMTAPSGAEKSWTGVIQSQSASSAVAIYALASSGADLDEAGTWRMWLQWTMGGVTPGPRSEVTTFQVLRANQA